MGPSRIPASWKTACKLKDASFRLQGLSYMQVKRVRSSGNWMANIGVETPTIKTTAFLESVKPAGIAFSAVQATAACLGASYADTQRKDNPSGCV